MFCRTDTIVNSIAIWKMKKPSEIIIKAGSCLLLNKLPANYKELEDKGIRERLNEGFGKVKFFYTNQ
ncbi:MAG TPA: hypothetical protein PLU62_11180 [Ignavibacteriales bacterium]|nr:hypothetical protein [Ignavibacteriales bacterium]HRT98708.1 hypothetical protein [Ignavibacteriales bacterium]